MWIKGYYWISGWKKGGQRNNFKSYVWKTNNDCYRQKENLKARDIVNSLEMGHDLLNARTKEFSVEENTQKRVNSKWKKQMLSSILWLKLTSTKK